MCKHKIMMTLLLLGSAAASLRAQDADLTQIRDFADASSSVQEQLVISVEELTELRQEITAEKLPLNRELRALEDELRQVRSEFQQVTREVDSSSLELANLRRDIEARAEETGYLSNLLGEYVREFEAQLHIAELPRYKDAVGEAQLALENTALDQALVYDALIAVLSQSLDRLSQAMGGTRFEGTAVDETGVVHGGTFVMVGPAALFRSESGDAVGTAEQRLGSLEPACIPFASLDNTMAASEFVAGSGGAFLLDPSLGNAHKIAATEESLVEHMKKGGPVMYPIIAMAAAALLVGLVKWLSLAWLRKPSRRSIEELLSALRVGDEEAAQYQVGQIKGPVGEMLAAGVEHLHEPRELVEEVMYERVLTTRLRLDRFLPFISICAASAPLLGLLGTVTGIINTFKLITVFGSGDVKTLSGGISEALITTEFGLIVAIPCLLMHAFLSRKARGSVSQMETAAVSFVNQISKRLVDVVEPAPLLTLAAAGEPAPREPELV